MSQPVFYQASEIIRVGAGILLAIGRLGSDGEKKEALNEWKFFK